MISLLCNPFLSFSCVCCMHSLFKVYKGLENGNTQADKKKRVMRGYRTFTTKHVPNTIEIGDVTNFTSLTCVYIKLAREWWYQVMNSTKGPFIVINGYHRLARRHGSLIKLTMEYIHTKGHIAFFHLCFHLLGELNMLVVPFIAWMRKNCAYVLY